MGKTTYNERIAEDLSEFIGEYLQTKSNRYSLFVLIGFSWQELDKLREGYAFDNCTNRTLEYIDNPDIKAQRATELFAKQRNKEVYGWCMFEDFSAIGIDFLAQLIDVIFVRNPVYLHYVPGMFSFVGDSNLVHSENEISESVEGLIENRTELARKYYLDVKVLNDSIYVIHENNNYESIELPIRHRSGLVQHRHYDASSFPITCEDDYLELEQLISDSDALSNIFYCSLSTDMQNEEIEKCLKSIAYIYDKIIQIRGIQATTGNVNNKYAKECYAILKKYWGYEGFRDLEIYINPSNKENPTKTKTINQIEIINTILFQAESALEGNSYRDVFVTSPTGSGKSLMFQIPAIYLAEKKRALTLIVSPLIGLMNDQVHSLEIVDVAFAATINSEISPLMKDEIAKKIEDGSVSILYLSPETLLSRSDITNLIGSRNIGLVVIDEAHIVTTWGKAFRSDYWYLGNYLRRLRNKYRFPITTFTATAIIGGIEDMYAETRDSLELRDPISYFGIVKRDNIDVVFNQYNPEKDFAFREYRSIKFKVTLGRLEELAKENKKVLVYFPFVSLIKDFLSQIRTITTSLSIDNIAKYYGNLSKVEKRVNFEDFRDGKRNIMLATKAFGMGIDIKDIDVVYHFAPTGNVCDYVQEIGRAARNGSEGLALFDYLNKDFTFVNQLYGISTLRSYQLINVLRKIYDIGKTENYNQRLLISSDDFEYIFSKRKDEDDADIDNKLKTALLILEKDFILKMGYSPIVARPRAIFTDGYFIINNHYSVSDLPEYFRRNISEYENGIFRIGLKNIWEEEYRAISFPRFKFDLYSGNGRFENIKKMISPIAVLNVTPNKEWGILLDSIAPKLIDIVMDFLNEKFSLREWFSIALLSRRIEEKTFIEYANAVLVAEAVLNVLKNINDRSVDSNFASFLLINEKDEVKVYSSRYIEIRSYFERCVTELNENIISKKSNEKVQIKLKDKNGQLQWYSIMSIMEAFDLLTYQSSGGDNPEIFVRINSYRIIEREIENKEYRNRILENVLKRHRTSVEMLTYLFQNESKGGDFWDIIEKYFLGIIPVGVIEKTG